MSELERMVEGVVAVVRRDGRFLMIQRAEGILAGGAWCFVGGSIEPGEPQHEAVVREFREEVGGSVRAIRKVWEVTRGASLRLHWWLVEMLDEALAPNPAEVQAIRWCTRDEIIALPNVLATNLAFLDAIADDSLHL